MSVTNELNAAIANQEQSIRNQSEQIAMQRENLKRIDEQLVGEEKIKEEYRSELRQKQENYDRQVRNLMICFIAAVIILAVIVFVHMFLMNWANTKEEYNVVVPAVEVTEEY
ncbi:hypothetical protein SAMN02910456_02720 [Ruminococcaceae bacterium YRB3002]|nr:hypothetical protein SAMN02910456_02720 [Ruminococcaceae bacterium YRB3002]